MSVLDGKQIVLGVSGGIAAYKAVELASRLVQDGSRVEVIMTAAAQQFIQPLTFAAITHAPVLTDPFAAWDDDFAGHVSLAASADLLIVAPATAATIARLALGLADDLLGLVALSTTAAMLVAPAMEHGMYHHPATVDHLQTLASRGATIVGPQHGRLASGAAGDGRMEEPEVIASVVRRLLTSRGVLTGAKVVVSAGGTREPIDPVRYIGNRSSGRMGYAIAAAARAQGANVVLVTGPTAIAPPAGVDVVQVETALQMQRALETATADADILFMAAAVADYRAGQPSEHKIKKSAGAAHLELQLIQNPDILSSLRQPRLLKVGFAAETDDLLGNAAAKLTAKRLAMIVANDAESTIGMADSAATLLFADGRTVALPRMAKEALADEIVRAAAALRVDGTETS